MSRVAHEKEAQSPAANRRKERRFKFTASISVEDLESGRCIQATVHDLSQHGCQVVTTETFPLQTEVNAIITRGDTSCSSRARVVYCQSGRVMGLLFVAIEVESLQTLTEWISDAQESEWLALNRRRSQRVFLKLPLRVLKENGDGARHEEQTETVSVSAHGALFLFSTALNRGQLISMVNTRTGAAAECMVVYTGKTQGSRVEVGAEFLLPNPLFWNVFFPPRN